MLGRVLILQATSQLQQQLELWGVLIVLLVLLIGVPVVGIRRLGRGKTGSQWERLFAKANERCEGRDLGPLVTFKCHTYSGFLVFFTQTEHAPKLPRTLALEYLRQLHRYNLVNCLVPYPGILYVPVLSWLNYLSQRRGIERQARGLPTAAPTMYDG